MRLGRFRSGRGIYLQERRILGPKFLAVGISASKSNIRACYFNGTGSALKKALVECRGEGLAIDRVAGSKGRVGGGSCPALSICGASSKYVIVGEPSCVSNSSH
jgi:hypothetical protein